MPTNPLDNTSPADTDFAKIAAEHLRDIKNYLNLNVNSADALLAKILTVDGAESGLDADLLDGLNSTAYAKLAGGNAFTGAQTMANGLAITGNSSVTGTFDVSGDLETLTNFFTGGNSDMGAVSGLSTHLLRGAVTATGAFVAPSINGILPVDTMVFRGTIAEAAIDTATLSGFYLVNYVGASRSLLVYNSGGSVGIVQVETSFDALYRWRNKTDSTTWTGWRTIWHSGNDGSGSGLDADIMRGYAPDFGASPFTYPLRDASGHIYAVNINQSSASNDGALIGQIMITTGVDGFLRKASIAQVRDVLNVALIAPASGITVTNADGVAGDPTLALNNDLLALENLGSTGIAVRSAANTWVQRAIAVGNGMAVLNGNGVSGNPTVQLTTYGGFQVTSSFWNGGVSTVTLNLPTAVSLGFADYKKIVVDLYNIGATVDYHLWCRVNGSSANEYVWTLISFGGGGTVDEGATSTAIAISRTAESVNSPLNANLNGTVTFYMGESGLIADARVLYDVTYEASTGVLKRITGASKLPNSLGVAITSITFFMTTTGSPAGAAANQNEGATVRATGYLA